MLLLFLFKSKLLIHVVRLHLLHHPMLPLEVLTHQHIILPFAQIVNQCSSHRPNLTVHMHLMLQFIILVRKQCLVLLADEERFRVLFNVHGDGLYCMRKKLFDCYGRVEGLEGELG